MRVRGVEDLDGLVAAGTVAIAPKLVLQAQDLLLRVGEEGGYAGLDSLAGGRAQGDGVLA